MRCLGIDYGRRRIGLALSDPTGLIASPFLIIENKGPKKNFARLAQIIQEKDVGQIVLGLPLHADGRESEMSAEARQFGELFQPLNLPVAFVDERYTSLAAEEAIGNQPHRKNLIDKVAASFILQMYLDERRKNNNEG